MTPWQDILIGILSVGYFLLIATTIIVVVLENRQPAKTTAWVLILGGVPVVGWILFYFFGQNIRKERYISKRAYDLLTQKALDTKADETSESECSKYGRLIKFNLNRARARLTRDNKTTLMWDGTTMLAALLQDIKGAKHHIHLQSYIIEEDEVGGAVVQALIEKAKQGIEVRLLYDHVGCWRMNEAFLKPLCQAGGEVHAFMPVHFRKLTHRANYRNHRKIVVIDGKIGYMGGMNLAERYLSKERGEWRDAHMRIEGGAVTELQRIFIADWYFTTQDLPYNAQYFPAHFSSQTPNTQGAYMQIVLANPVARYPHIMYALTWMIQNAKRYLYLQTPYFMPSEVVMQALRTAALSGVDIRIMIPEKPDAKLLRWGNDSYVEDALQAGIRIYMYENGFLHSKCAVADDDWCTVGSSNMDQRSFDNNFEVNAFIYDEAVAKEVKTQFFVDAKYCRELNLEEWHERPLYKKCLESATRIISPIL
jgi:cardiolipin synthase